MTGFANLADGGLSLVEALRPVAMSLDAPLLVAIVALGVFPRLLQGVTDGSVQSLMRLFGG